jgi:hypothetical protein
MRHWGTSHSERNLMRQTLHSIAVKNMVPFEIKCEMTVTVRIDDKRAKLFKQVRIERKLGAIVLVELRDFSGAEFAFKVSLKERNATLRRPNLSGWGDGEIVARQALKLIEELLTRCPRTGL